MAEEFEGDYESLPPKRKKKKHLRLSYLRFKRRYIFTDNVHPVKGVMSFILGVVAAATLFVCVRMAYFAGGIASEKLGMALVWAFLYSVAGLVLGIMGERQRNIFRLFPTSGIVICTVDILIMIGMVVAGFYM
ncbi:DUF6142 family protein [Butyrivibrio sp. MC2013]|uniref:DUF6142 family protein n=1 Tax=Butyrivibrio sp. MC2013 TaxID=1280686 RepID=UPI000404AF46|nr:DUF6142 family protein [Butyrivibrio sp. MC2013]